jgi:hypothetical protein
MSMNSTEALVTELDRFPGRVAEAHVAVRGLLAESTAIGNALFPAEATKMTNARIEAQVAILATALANFDFSSVPDVAGQVEA